MQVCVVMHSMYSGPAEKPEHFLNMTHLYAGMV